MVARGGLIMCHSNHSPMMTRSTREVYRHSQVSPRSFSSISLHERPVFTHGGSNFTPKRARMRKTYVLAGSGKEENWRFDPMLVGGDAFVLLSMQMSSSTLPIQNTGTVSLLLLATWTAVATAKRDYSVNLDTYDAWSVAEPVISAIKVSALTWVIFAPLMAIVYGSFISNNLLYIGDAIPVAAASAVSHPGGLWALQQEQLDLCTPELEVIIASLICVTSWRAFYSAFRSWSNLM